MGPLGDFPLSNRRRYTLTVEMQYPAPLAHALSDFPCRISALLISIVVFIKWHHPLSYFLFSLTATAEKENPTETIIVLSEYLRKGGNCIDFRVTLKPDYTATITVNPAYLISETSSGTRATDIVLFAA